MSNAEQKNKKNVAGAWYCTDPEDDGGEGCIACSVCYSGAPEIFAEDEEGHAYVKKQPSTDEETALAEEQKDACPVSSIGNDA